MGALGIYILLEAKVEKDKNTSHETVEEKLSKTATEETKAETMKKTEKETASKETVAKETAKEDVKDKKDDKKSEEGEGLADSDIIDINKEESKKESKKEASERKAGGRKSPKTTDDFIKKQKKRKRTKKIVVLLVVILLIGIVALWIRNMMNKAKEALAGFQANNVQTAYVEKKTLYDSKDATGTLYALESRTISRALAGTGQSGADIVSVNVEVGDRVTAGDVLVEFSSEDIEKKINETKEDIGTKKQLQAINKEDAQRTYVYQYENAATSMTSTAKNVERMLERLHEACDAYGDAKRKRDDYRDSNGDDPNYKSMLESLENAVSSAYQAQQQAQQNYDDAVAAQAEGQGGISSISNSLSEADSTYKKAQINSGEEIKQSQRTLNNYIDSLDDYVVHATISGIVTEVNVSEGNTFTSGNVLTIQDDSSYKAEVLVDEYDIPKVKKAFEEKKARGQELEVVVKTDATGDNEYKGHVTLIAPTSTTTTTGGASSSGSGSGNSAGGSSSGSVNYKVSIVLDEKDDAFMIGMSAKVAIVVNQSPDDALCVPYNCIEETSEGKYIVKVMDEHGDKSTADDQMSDFGDMGGKKSRKDDTKGVNGIVIENDTDSSDSKPGKKGSLADKLRGKGKDEEAEVGRRYREVEVDKIFDTDFYAAVVPKTEGSLKDGDEVMIVTEKANGNDIMAMFGGPGGPGGF